MDQQRATDGRYMPLEEGDRKVLPLERRRARQRIYNKRHRERMKMRGLRATLGEVTGAFVCPRCLWRAEREQISNPDITEFCQNGICLPCSRVRPSVLIRWNLPFRDWYCDALTLRTFRKRFGISPRRASSESKTEIRWSSLEKRKKAWVWSPSERARGAEWQTRVVAAHWDFLQHDGWFNTKVRLGGTPPLDLTT